MTDTMQDRPRFQAESDTDGPTIVETMRDAAAALDTLHARVAALEAACGEGTMLNLRIAVGEVERQERRAAHAEAEVARLREVLAEYGRHAEGCSAAVGSQYRCKCGWDRERTALRGTETK